MRARRATTSRLAQAALLAELKVHQRRAARLAGAGPEGQQRFRQAALDELRRHAVASSPFYAERHRGLERAPLSELPVVTKDDLVERFDDVVTDRHLTRRAIDAHMADGPDAGLVLGRYRVAVSSGSSGRPGLFAFDRHEWVAQIAAAAAGRALARRGAPPLPRPPRRAAKVASPSPWHLSSQVGATLNDPRKPRLGLDADLPLEEMASRLESFGPDVLSAQPAVLGLLAAAQQRGALHLEPLQVFSSGGVLTSGTRKAVAEAWGHEPFDQYVATEGGTLASECGAHQGLHLLDDRLILEVVDDDDRPVPDGETGTRVLLTVLDSRTVPLVRYELADRVRLATGACPCGLGTPRIEAVEGKTAEVVLLRPGDGGEPVPIPPSVFTAVMDLVAVSGWQAVHDVDGLHVAVTGAPPDLDLAAVGAEVTAAVRRLVPGAPAVEVRPVSAIPAGPGGKRPLVRSSLER